jgi:hypothetical protein
MINSAEDFVRLRTSNNMDEYLQAAWDEAPLEVWIEVIEKYPDMREWVAHNKSIAIKIMEILSDDEDDREKFTIASKNRLPEFLQLKLAKDPDSSVRNRIAFNKKATLKSLEVLLNDEDEEIRVQVKKRIEEGKYK